MEATMGEAAGEPIPNLPTEHPEPKEVFAVGQAEGRGEAAGAAEARGIAAGSGHAVTWTRQAVGHAYDWLAYWFLVAAASVAAGIRKPGTRGPKPGTIDRYGEGRRADDNIPNPPREVFAIGQAEGHGEAAGAGGKIVEAIGHAGVGPQSAGFAYGIGDARAVGLAVHKSGAKPQYDWGLAMERLREILDERGDPLDPKEARDGWRSEEDAGREVSAYILKHEGKTPDRSTVMRHVRDELKRWREAQQGIINN
jgi:hypothetical protein